MANINLQLSVISQVQDDFLRRKIPAKTNLGVVIGILNNISYNQKLIEARMTGNQNWKQFRFYNWKANQEKRHFLDTDLVTKINQAFSQVIVFNSRIDQARKYHSPDPISKAELETLETALDDAKTSLITWLKEDAENENTGG